MDVLEKYGVDYILVGDYERSAVSIDQDAIDQRFPLIFESKWGNMRVYQAVKADD